MNCLNNFYKFSYFICAIFSQLSFGEPYTPASEQEVVATVKYSSDFEDLRKLHSSIVGTAKIADANNAILIAERYIDLGKEFEEPRFIGYAESILDHLFNDKKSNKKLLELRIKVNLFNHNFQYALDDINILLQDDKYNTSLLLKASLILQDLGRFEESESYCSKVAVSDYSMWALCESDLASVTGKSKQAYALLSSTLLVLFTEEDKSWAHTLMAQIAWRTGEAKKAEEHFLKAMQLAKNDIYINREFLDFLFLNNRYRDMLVFLDDRELDYKETGLYFPQYCLAQSFLDDSETQKCKRSLTDRYKNRLARGDKPHYKDEIYFYENIAMDNNSALKLAEENWSLNRKPSDILMLARTAWTCGDKRVIAYLNEWIAKVHYEDIRLDGYLKI